MLGGEPMCKHCFFGLNYDEESRLTFDKKCLKDYKVSIADYILECDANHCIDNCPKASQGCLLCDYKTGVKIINILNPEKINHNVQEEVIETVNEEYITEKVGTDNHNTNSVNVSDDCDVRFCGDVSNIYQFKIPKKLTI